VTTRVAPSTALDRATEELLSGGLVDNDRLAELGRPGARLVLQRAVEDEATEFLGRARYQRTLEARGSRNGVRPRRVLTAEGELEVQIPQLRNTAERFVSRVIPDVGMAIRTRPLEVLIIGAYVRGLSDRDIESLLEEAGLGKASRSTVSRVCQELRDPYRAFRARSLAEIKLLVLSWTRSIFRHGRAGPRKACWWLGVTPSPANVFCSTSASATESATRTGWKWGRGLTRRGLRAPWLTVVDGAPGLIKAVEELWPDSDRQRCTVHRLRNVIASCPRTSSRTIASAMSTGRPSTRRAPRPTARLDSERWWASSRPTMPCLSRFWADPV
jgi:putative transposase